jgi:cation diffusion facilitator family transporter
MTDQEAFPEAIELPAHVQEERRKRNNLLVEASKKGIAVRLLIILVELLGYSFFLSSTLYADAVASTVDIASTIFLIFCIRKAEKPPDKDHPFGHGRYEPIGGLQLGIFLAVIGLLVLFQQVFFLISASDAEHQIPLYLCLIPLGAAFLMEASYRFLHKTAKQEKSPALEGDAYHYRIDALNSLFAAVTLAAASYWPEWTELIDHGGAMGIALLMLLIGVFAAKNNFDQLMDRVPDDEFFAIVRDAALRVPGIRDTEKIRIQHYGPDAHVDIDVEVDPELSVKKAHELSQQVRTSIQHDWPSVRDVTVHIEPFYPNDH